MAISELLAAAMKRIPWGQVADVAIQRGPDLIRKLRARLQKPPALEVETTAGMAKLSERILELERTVVRQADIIQGQNRKTELLEGICKTLQARLQISMAISTITALLSLVLLILLLRK